MFYKFSAIPTNDANILEIFKCPKWDLELDVKIIIESQNNKQEKVIILKPGFTTEWNELRLTATSMTIAPLPTLSQLFVSDKMRIAILESNNEEIFKF